MSDLFQDGVPIEFIERIWSVMQEANWHTYQVLTKRPRNMAAILQRLARSPLPNVWLGTSVESGAYRERIDELTRVSSLIRFISFEPLLGPIGKVNLAGIHWAIVGGESGPHARPMNVDWVSEIQEQCRRQGVAFFFKQWGGKNKKATGRAFNGRTWDEFPTFTSLSTD
jgi:protein gp37